MKAVFITQYGGPEVLQVGEQPMPTIGDDEMLVRVHAASINPVDYKIRGGMLKLMIRYAMPLTLGQDCAGVVTAVGRDVRRFKVGDEIYVRLSKDRIGSFAEFAAVRESDAALKPANLSHVEAVSIPLVGLTAWQVMCDLVKLKAGQKALIHAGSGGVGTFAIQLAKHLGATVYTTASTRNAELVKRLGADVIIDYKTQRFEDVAKDCDLVFDTQGGDILARSFASVRRGGAVITIGGIPTRRVMQEWRRPLYVQWIAAFLNRKFHALARTHGVTYDYYFMSPSGTQLAAIAKLIENKTIVPVVDKVFSLDDAKAAFAYAEAGHATGKVIITPYQDTGK